MQWKGKNNTPWILLKKCSLLEKWMIKWNPVNERPKNIDNVYPLKLFQKKTWKTMKIEIPLPSHYHFVVQWVFKQYTAFLFLSSASITKNQGFVPAGQTLILCKTFHHHHNSHHWWKKIPLSSIESSIWRKRYIQNKDKSSRLLREEILVNVSVIFFYLSFFLSHPLIIHSSRGGVEQ